MGHGLQMSVPVSYGGRLRICQDKRDKPQVISRPNQLIMRVCLRLRPKSILLKPGAYP